MIALSTRRIREFQETLLTWFAGVKRPLPWRSHRSLYGTWIAEIMLQQTTVAVVVPYWERFMARFPDVQSLARADEQEVLAQWSGLGYYRRARHLHQAAREIVAAGSSLPTTRQDWLALPGIGPYASGAIVSQALGLSVPAVDANARRVLTRWLVDDPNHLHQLKPAALEILAQSLVPPEDPGAWNEAVMELGALICKARQPGCKDCPVLDLCRAGLAGAADQIPAPAKPVLKIPTMVALLVIRRGKQTFLARPGSPPLLTFGPQASPVRSDLSGLHVGLWGLPSTPWVEPSPEDENLQVKICPELARGMFGREKRQQNPGSPEIRELGQFNHAITRYRLKVRVHLVTLPESMNFNSDGKKMALNDDCDYYLGRDFFMKTPRLEDPGAFTINPLEQPISNLAGKALKMVEESFG